MNKSRYIFTYKDFEGGVTRLTFSGDSDIHEVIRQLKAFLLACSYHINTIDTGFRDAVEEETSNEEDSNV